MQPQIVRFPRNFPVFSKIANLTNNSFFQFLVASLLSHCFILIFFCKFCHQSSVFTFWRSLRFTEFQYLDAAMVFWIGCIGDMASLPTTNVITLSAKQSHAWQPPPEETTFTTAFPHTFFSFFPGCSYLLWATPSQPLWFLMPAPTNLYAPPAHGDRVAWNAHQEPNMWSLTISMASRWGIRVFCEIQGSMRFQVGMFPFLLETQFVGLFSVFNKFIKAADCRLSSIQNLK